ncbi:MAG: hypothetical protein FJW29_11650 [Acidobacteria bacterium]|nr:hypothetical protein [Acidobacteriota bacterium]
MTRTGVWMPFRDAARVIRTAALPSRAAFRQWRRSGARPEGFPSNPDRVYADRWKGWAHFLGTQSVRAPAQARLWPDTRKPFVSHRAFVHICRYDLRIASARQWRAWCRTHRRERERRRLPANPVEIYPGFRWATVTGFVVAYVGEALPF